jgi:hypothetical protein
MTRCAGKQRLLSEMLADWRSDFPGLAVRIDVTRGDPTALLMEASREAAVLVIAYPRTSGLLPSILSHDSSPAIAAGPVVLVRTAHSRDRGSTRSFWRSSSCQGGRPP